ncbi:MAG: ferrous iron transport protein A [Solobacterium sp.]|nr:ferrous iron transport protein A [Solobacterium sp.]
MKLNELAAGTNARVKTLQGDAHFLNRTASIGLTEGVPFQVVRNDRNMPMLLYVRETLLALNRADCERIEAEVKA